MGKRTQACAAFKMERKYETKNEGTRRFAEPRETAVTKTGGLKRQARLTQTRDSLTCSGN